MKNISAEILRILDANINRTGEGLRVLEEFARLSLDNRALTQQLKDLRHRVLHTGSELQKQLLNARDAADDVGSTMEVAGEVQTKDVSEIVIANARRVQESLRVMEELAKTPGTGLDSEIYRQGRFALYTIEKELLGCLSRKNKVTQITGLYVVIDAEWLRGRQPAELARQIVHGGAKTIQLRCKNMESGPFLQMAKEIQAVCRETGTIFIVNDNLGVALACRADGLHVGQADLPADLTRQLIPIDMVLGVSVRTETEAKKALADGADYLGAGAVFDTATKDSKPIGLKNLEKIKKITGLPVVAIGGIKQDNIKSVFDRGCECAAVISAVLGAEDAEHAARKLVDIIGGQ